MRRYGEQPSRWGDPPLIADVLAGVFAVAVVVALACSGAGRSDEAASSPTGSSTVTSSSSDAPAAVPTNQAVVGSVHIWKTGVIDATGPLSKVGCWFRYGPHEQELLGELLIELAVGESESFGPPALPANTCIQVDVADSCARSSIMPGLIAAEMMGPCPRPTPTPSPTPTPCVPGEWKVVKTEGPTCGRWGSCDQYPSVSCEPKKCYLCQECATITTESDGCKTRTSVSDDIEKKEVPCPRPTPEPALCYYTPDCRTSLHVSSSTSCPDWKKRQMCQAEGGAWANWNGQSNQCRLELPGILKSNFRLVPGQSHPACLKYTGN